MRPRSWRSREGITSRADRTINSIEIASACWCGFEEGDIEALRHRQLHDPGAKLLLASPPVECQRHRAHVTLFGTNRYYLAVSARGERQVG